MGVTLLIFIIIVIIFLLIILFNKIKAKDDKERGKHPKPPEEPDRME